MIHKMAAFLVDTCGHLWTLFVANAPHDLLSATGAAAVSAVIRSYPWGSAGGSLPCPLGPPWAAHAGGPWLRRVPPHLPRGLTPSPGL